MSRALTKDEIFDLFMQEVRAAISRWEKRDDCSLNVLCEGVAADVLKIIDGETLALPGFDLVARPHPDDKPYDIENGVDFVEDGTVINDGVSLGMLLQEH